MQNISGLPEQRKPQVTASRRRIDQITIA